ncbi:MAG: hypothetical protein Q8M02_13590 [Candidatus Didemnitutus sp.]|nr:hypothetical protein [Candidatus Didemnitutus sp.]
MSLNESIVEDAALEWLGELGYAVGHGPASHADRRDSFGEVGLVGRLREAIRRQNPVIPPSRTLATLRDALLPKLLSGELSKRESYGRRELSLPAALLAAQAGAAAASATVEAHA